MIFSKLIPFILLIAGQTATASVGRFSAVEGDVRINGQVADVGTNIALGSVVETGSGKCTLLLGKTSVIHLDSDSKLKVTQHLVQSNGEESSTVDLPHGRTRALVRNTSGKRIFRIRTRAAVMGVRGTHIYIDNPKGGKSPPQFVTLEGSADLEFASRPGLQVQKLTLATNQSFTPSLNAPKLAAAPLTNFVREISTDNAKDLARQVAPPPREVRRPEDTGKPDADSKDPKKKKPRRGAGRRPSLPGGQVPLDPLRDTPRFEVKVRVTGKRAP